MEILQNVQCFQNLLAHEKTHSFEYTLAKNDKDSPEVNSGMVVTLLL